MGCTSALQCRGLDSDPEKGKCPRATGQTGGNRGHREESVREGQEQGESQEEALGRIQLKLIGVSRSETSTLFIAGKCFV